MIRAMLAWLFGPSRQAESRAYWLRREGRKGWED
jgi:hypothetical protein